ncbi:hypothetical protein [Inquilinus sp. CAU 1745]|uniref:hypothetical protein n=1 Tax=Inquilinus sp. CAU 1745 TaxID=3140369 RepID=UPI00325B416D
MQHLDRKARRERLHRDALEAWVDFQQTNLHATAEKVDAWLVRLEEGDDVKPPVCHA